MRRGREPTCPRVKFFFFLAMKTGIRYLAPFRMVFVGKATSLPPHQHPHAAQTCPDIGDRRGGGGLASFFLSGGARGKISRGLKGRRDFHCRADLFFEEIREGPGARVISACLAPLPPPRRPVQICTSRPAEFSTIPRRAPHVNSLFYLPGVRAGVGGREGAGAGRGPAFWLRTHAPA